MSLIAVNVVYGGNTDFITEAPASDGKQEWVNSDYIVDMHANIGTVNPGGAIFRLAPPNAPYVVNYWVTNTPTIIAPSDVA